ncbi:MAG: DUF3108 domain-containing protein [candidate division Zixibacteria bacterium]|nr:DUF3108 domain-containing protein [candidate division Zixibacteria bacterium]
MLPKSIMGHVFLSVLIIVGLIPLGYFVTVEFEIAHASSDIASDSTSTVSTLDRVVENVAFGIGEKLTFDINYGFINAGTATMEVVDLIEYEERPCYRIVTRARSNSFFSSFYKVDDRVESICDAVGLFSWRFEKNLREGKYRADRTYEFDPVNSLVYYKKDTIETPPAVQDALSVFYWIRTQDMKTGKSIYVDNFTDGKLYPMEVRVLKEETITVEAGTFDCLVVEPLTQSVGVFKHEGKLKVWLTNDRLKMPVLMKSQVLVGSISAELTGYQLGDIDIF